MESKIVDVVGPTKAFSSDYKIPKMAKKFDPAPKRVSSFGDFLVNLDASRRIKLDEVNFLTVLKICSFVATLFSLHYLEVK
jgi:hypothetical protein